jgi:glutathione peroxidase
MTIHDVAVRTLRGEPTVLDEDKALLIVNVASRCGFTPQYEGLERLQKNYADRGFSVIGVPCNQFKGQEPGSAEEIEEFCSVTYGVTFPLLEKTDVNGPDRHPLYEVLTATADSDGNGGDVGWNFEKFLVAPGGDVVARFRTHIEPEAPEIVDALERILPS